MEKLILLFVLIFGSTFAQNDQELFTSANTLYKNENYKEAISSYEKLIDNKLISSELYYNLGNCYYKLNKVAPTIYNYEKALQLDPNNEDAQNNLIFAKRLTLDRIEELPKTFFQRINENYISKFSINNWAIISIVFSILGALFFIFYYNSFSSTKKRVYFFVSILSFILLLTSLRIAFHQYNKKTNTIEAIVFATEVSVKNEPTKSASEIFMIHEGTKVIVLDSVDDWNKIKLINGKIGWLKKESINLLNLF